MGLSSVIGDTMKLAIYCHKINQHVMCDGIKRNCKSQCEAYKHIVVTNVKYRDFAVVGEGLKPIQLYSGVTESGDTVLAE